MIHELGACETVLGGISFVGSLHVTQLGAAMNLFGQVTVAPFLNCAVKLSVFSHALFTLHCAPTIVR
jgi:hypothetical protein